MEIGNLFDNLPEGSKEEVFDVLQKGASIEIERIISSGHTSPESGWYDQERNEWVLVVEGAATLEFENGESKSLKAGSFVNIPAHCRHKVSWTDPNVKTIWLAIHY